MRDTTTVGELAEKITGGNERAMRKLLNDALGLLGGQRFDEYVTDPDQRVDLDVVIALAAQRTRDAAGQRVTTFLRDMKA